MSITMPPADRHCSAGRADLLCCTSSSNILNILSACRFASRNSAVREPSPWTLAFSKFTPWSSPSPLHLMQTRVILMVPSVYLYIPVFCCRWFCARSTWNTR
ncbi:hypothetical protein BD311DRAFT_433269 [Dichomitus squalens]|uniref:Uncharacterized protein n=1 Tax=Dichomitus squalens TaxID=114155 RepID=A0A4Q9N0P4_9APHY|nr:hypothetical protein BD311DRAFT_433269 [Dichomitus squalens]